MLISQVTTYIFWDTLRVLLHSLKKENINVGPYMYVVRLDRGANFIFSL